MPRPLTPKQAAEELGLSEATLATWRCRKLRDLVFYRIGRRVFYELADVQAFKARNRAV